MTKTKHIPLILITSLSVTSLTSCDRSRNEEEILRLKNENLDLKEMIAGAPKVEETGILEAKGVTARGVFELAMIPRVEGGPLEVAKLIKESPDAYHLIDKDIEVKILKRQKNFVLLYSDQHPFKYFYATNNFVKLHTSKE